MGGKFKKYDLVVYADCDPEDMALGFWKRYTRVRRAKNFLRKLSAFDQKK